jgi:hypothetical protein
MTEKKPKPIYVGYLGPTNGYSFFSQTTLTHRTIINDTWELMEAAEDIEKFEDMESDQFVISHGNIRGAKGKMPESKPSELLAERAARKKEKVR